MEILTAGFILSFRLDLSGGQIARGISKERIVEKDRHRADESICQLNSQVSQAQSEDMIHYASNRLVLQDCSVHL